MYLASLKLHDFRNYDDQALAFSPGLNVIFGDNAQGKTNLLEAIHFLATGRSQRTAQDRDLLRQGTTALHLRAHVSRLTGDLTLDLTYASEGRKHLKINGLPEPKIAKLVGRLAVVYFGPDDLQLIKGPPAGRRRFLDIELSQVSASYLHHLQVYSRVLVQRNALLREAVEKGHPPAMLEVWDEQLLGAGAELVARRVHAMTRIAELAAHYHALLADEKEALAVSYQSSAWEAGQSLDVAAIRERLAAELRRVRSEDLRRGQTTAGPHRDDITFRIDGRDARLFASQGQQRTAVLALKFAELGYMRGELDEYPVLLLDDVASELDPSRRHFLLNSVQEDVQSFVTCTDLADLTAREWPADHRLFRVTAGHVQRYERGA